MKKLVIRKVETLKTTAAMYYCGCPTNEPPECSGEGPILA